MIPTQKRNEIRAILHKFVAEVEAFWGLERHGRRGKHYLSQDGELVRARKMQDKALQISIWRREMSFCIKIKFLFIWDYLVIIYKTILHNY